MKRFAGMLAAALLTLTPLPAFAHAQLVTSSPRPSATVYKLPAKITLTFDDDLIELGSANLIEVVNPKGKKVQRGETAVIGSVETVALAASTVLGRYKVTWRALSADGHPVSGFYYFYLAQKK